MPAGRATLNRSFYGPIAEAMADGPRRVGDLLAMPDLEGRRDNPAELIGILVGLELAEPAARPGAEPAPQALRLNRVTSANFSRAENPGRQIAAASYALGTGAPCQLSDLYMMERIEAGDGEGKIDDWVRDLGASLDEESCGRLREVFVKALRVRPPILRAQGVF